MGLCQAIFAFMPEAILIVIACANSAEAEMIARRLLDLRLIACASVGGAIRSFFDWKGERQAADEVPLLLKTTRARFEAVRAEARRLHSYETPEILAIPVTAGDPEYLAWLAAAVE